MDRLNGKDVVGGVLFAGIGLFFVLGGLEYRFGTAQRMGPGYLPVLVGSILVVLSLTILARGLRVRERIPALAWRPIAAVSGSLITFGLSMRYLGLVPAVMLTVFVAALGDRASRPLSTLVVALVLAFGAWGVFRYGLGLPMPAFRGLF